MQFTDVRTEEGQSLNREISREIVRLYKEYLGRGPTRAQTTIRDDLIVCVLEDSLTKAEAKLADGGKSDVVRSIRREFQDSMREELTGIIERLTGREVCCLLSDHSPRPDFGVEVIVLRPREGSATNGAAAGADGADRQRPD